MQDFYRGGRFDKSLWKYMPDCLFDGLCHGPLRICTSAAAHTVVSCFQCGLVSAAAAAALRCSSPVCNDVTRLQPDRCAPLSVQHTHTHACTHTDVPPPPLPLLPLRTSFHTLLVGPELFPVFAPRWALAWLMGPSERGHDPGYEVLPVSTEAVFRDLQWSQETAAGAHPVGSDAATL